MYKSFLHKYLRSLDPPPPTLAPSRVVRSMRDPDPLSTPLWPHKLRNGRRVNVVFPLLGSEHPGVAKTRSVYDRETYLRRLVERFNQLPRSRRKQLLKDAVGKPITHDMRIGSAGLRTRVGFIPPRVWIDVDSFTIRPPNATETEHR